MIIVLVVPFGGWFCVKEKSWIREFKARVCAALNYSLVAAGAAVVQGMALLLRAVVVQGTPTSTCDPPCAFCRQEAVPHHLLVPLCLCGLQHSKSGFRLSASAHKMMMQNL